MFAFYEPNYHLTFIDYIDSHGIFVVQKNSKITLSAAFISKQISVYAKYPLKEKNVPIKMKGNMLTF